MHSFVLKIWAHFQGKHSNNEYPPYHSSQTPSAHLDDKWFELIRLRSLQDAAKRHHCRVPVPPVRVLDVFFDEGEDVWDDVIFTARGQEHEAHACRFAGVPVIVVIILILTRV